jgi:BASS family bile acid:Na+ symporter
MKRNLPAIMTGVFTGALSSLVIIGGMCLVLGLDDSITAALLPKSITTAMAIPLVEPTVGLVPLTTGNFTVSFFSQVAGTLVAVVGFPMAGAFLVRKLYKGAQTLAQKLGNVSFLLWNIMLFITVSAAGKSIRETPDMGWKTLVWVGALSLGICVVNFTVGYWIVPRKLRREGSQVLGQKNTMFLLYIALTYGGPVPALGPTFYVLWQNLWNSFQMYMYDRRKVLRRKKAETSCHS